ncbi:hypothetical protein T484DRAFT_1637738, partial [Baffinella frigidus]
EAANPKPQTLNPKLQTPNPKPQAPNPKHQTPNTKHQTPNPEAGRGGVREGSEGAACLTVEGLGLSRGSRLLSKLGPAPTATCYLCETLTTKQSSQLVRLEAANPNP